MPVSAFSISSAELSDPMFVPVVANGGCCASCLPAGAASCRLRAHFTFVMPRLDPGQYLVAVAVADGTQADHVHHEWQHEAWQFTSTWPGEATGLVGIDVEPSWIVVDGGAVRSG